MVGNGTTDLWPYFPKVRIDAAFTYFNSPADNEQKNPIYFLYDLGDSFVKYQSIETEKSVDQQNIKDMTYNISSKAYRFNRWLWFLYSVEKQPETLGSFFGKISAVLSNPSDLLIFGTGNYCRANITQAMPLVCI